MSSPTDIEIRDVTDAETFALLPPCVDPRFDHRSCDYWEDDVRGAKTARPSWWQSTPQPAPPPRPPARSDNPFAPAPRDEDGFNPFAAPSDASSDPAFNPFAPKREKDGGAAAQEMPRKLRSLDRGRGIFGSYAKVLIQDAEPVGYAQFGPLSAYPRAQSIRELYPQLPSSPLPAVITCIATSATGRGRGLARALVESVVDDLERRGFAAVEVYPDVTLQPDEASAASPAFWRRCDFALAADDERYPVMRRELT